jgi:hypothetical protein
MTEAPRRNRSNEAAKRQQFDLLFNSNLSQQDRPIASSFFAPQRLRRYCG